MEVKIYKVFDEMYVTDWFWIDENQVGRIWGLLIINFDVADLTRLNPEENRHSALLRTAEGSEYFTEEFNVTPSVGSYAVGCSSRADAVVDCFSAMHGVRSSDLEYF